MTDLDHQSYVHHMLPIPITYAPHSENLAPPHKEVITRRNLSVELREPPVNDTHLHLQLHTQVYCIAQRGGGSEQPLTHPTPFCPPSRPNRSLEISTLGAGSGLLHRWAQRHSQAHWRAQLPPPWTSTCCTNYRASEVGPPAASKPARLARVFGATGCERPPAQGAAPVQG